MPNPRLLGIITALLLAAGASAADAAYTRHDLQTIELLIMNRKWAALREYIDAHPELLEGDNILAAELREYIATYKNGFIERLFTPPKAPKQDVLQQLKEQY